MSDERTDDNDQGDAGGASAVDDAVATGKDVVGKVEEKLGWLTGDRQAEAKGRLRQADADPETDADAERGPGDEDAAAAEAVDEAELQIRDEHGDLAPGVGPDEG